jgi:fructose 1,6-bisphosphate aldolase/phosphatase
MRSQGPFVPSILGAEEMEYTSRPDVLKELTSRFVSLDEKPKKKAAASKKAPAKKAPAKKKKVEVE